MITLRDWRPFLLTCLIALTANPIAYGESEVIQTARRRLFNRSAERETAQHATTRRPPAAPSARTAQGSTGRTAQPDPLLQLVERAIAKTSLRYLDADEHTPWQIMHGMVALRRDFTLTRGDGHINCVEFLSDAPTFRGETWWQVTEHGGRAHPFSVPYAFEGHANQFLALLSMSNLPLTHEFNVDGEQTVTMADMVNNAKMTVNRKEEITWTLWFLTHYIDVDSEWINESGEPWSLEELVRMQTKAPVINAPCGGCHGLFAIAYARNAYLHKHGRLRGVYYQADQKLNKHIELARSLQNRDGSFSTEFFKGPGASNDFNERLKASGHMLEWLMMAVPQSRLHESWLRRAIASIATDLIHNASQPAECGPLYHALNSLIMYRDRVKLQSAPAQPEEQLATGPSTRTDGGESEAGSDGERSVKSAQSPVPQVIPNRITTQAGPLESADSEVAVKPQPREGENHADGDDSPLSKRLARKAARRLAEQARDEADPEPTLAEEMQGPTLLRVPNTRPDRIAIEATGRSTR